MAIGWIYIQSSALRWMQLDKPDLDLINIGESSVVISDLKKVAVSRAF